MKSLRLIWILWFSFAATMAFAVYLFLSAITTASLRFWYCGPTSLAHQEETCRVGTKLLLLSYGVGAIALVLALATIWLHWRRCKESNNLFKPNPHQH